MIQGGCPVRGQQFPPLLLCGDITPLGPYVVPIFLFFTFFPRHAQARSKTAWACRGKKIWARRFY